MQRVHFLYLVSCLCLLGCHESKNEPDPDVTNSSACDSATFERVCAGGLAYRACIDGNISTEFCPNNTICNGGQCVPVVNQCPPQCFNGCNADGSCKSDSSGCPSHCTYGCNPDGTCVVADNCPLECMYGCHPNGTCKTPDPDQCPSECIYGCNIDGTCHDTHTPDVLEISYIPESCSDNTFVPYCYGQIRLSCQNNQVIQTNCSDYNLVCSYGECKALTMQTCSADDQKAHCVGNTLVYCDYAQQILQSENCGDNICTSIDGDASCYEPCDVDSNTNGNYCWGISKYVHAQCVESDDHHRVLAQFTADAEGVIYHECPDDQYCYKGSCAPGAISLDQGCSKGTFKPLCDRNIAYTCERDWIGEDYLNARTCDDATCVIYQNQAMCVNACSKDLVGTERTYCHYDDYEIELYSVTETCMKMNGGYYWIATAHNDCSDTCNEATGKCGSQLVEACDSSKDSERHYCAVDTSSNSRIGGEYHYSSIAIHEQCVDNHWVKQDSSDCTYEGCDIQKGQCKPKIPEEMQGKMCTAEALETHCMDGYHVSCDDSGIVSQATSCGIAECWDRYNCVLPCTEEQLGTYVMTECTSGSSEAYYECVKNNYTTEPAYFLQKEERECENGCSGHGCNSKHPDEGRLCHDETYISNCQNNVLAVCPWVGDRVKGYDCSAEGKICVNDEKYATCYEACTEADAQAQNLFCVDDDYYGLYSKGRKCLKNKDGLYYWTDEIKQYCSHGCDEATGECIYIHEKEGQNCELANDSYCDDQYKLICSGYHGTYSAEDCSKELPGGTCKMLETNHETGEQAPACVILCDNIDQERTYCRNNNYEEIYRCVENSGIQYYQTTKDTNYCSHGCDPETGACIIYHEKEGESCNSSTDPEYCADDKYVTCSGSTYSVRDCNEKMEGSKCALKDGKTFCYMPCDASQEGETRYICDSYSLREEQCTAMENGYFWARTGNNVHCEHGCDGEKGECVLLSPDEGKPCNPNTYITSCIGDDTLIHCSEDDNIVEAWKCWSSDVCAGNENIKANCYASCTAEGTSSTYCAYDNNIVTTTCTNVGGHLVDIEVYSLCYHGCENDQCLSSDISVGSECDESFVNQCDDASHYFMCNDGKIDMSSCDTGKVCVNSKYADTPSTCEIPGCTWGNRKYECTFNNTHHVYGMCRINQYGHYSYSGSYNSSCTNGCDPSTGLCL